MVALTSTKRALSPLANGSAKRAKSTSSTVLNSYNKLPDVNSRPQARTVPMAIFVWGSGSMCELGLGPNASTKEVKRPRLNPYLSKNSITAEGIVDFAVGGMHVLALDLNNVLWSWGANDSKALGRDTTQAKVALKSVDESEDSDDDGDLNEAESTPGMVENLPSNGLKIVQLAATDNLSAVLYENGDVYTWGTFRSNEGLLGYSKGKLIQDSPRREEGLKNVVQLAAGKDHMLALDSKGIVYSWGNGQQFQLGRKILERHKFAALEPQQFGLYNIQYISSGDFHCFAIDTNGKVYSWGLNQFGQCGITNAGGDLEDGSLIMKPTIIPALEHLPVKHIVGGEHHSLALTLAGDVYTWGRYDMKEVGIEEKDLPDYTFFDTHGKPRSVPIPTKVKFPQEPLKIKTVGAGSHHSFAVTSDGVMFAWGFGDTYALGLGPVDGDVEKPTRIANTATRDVDIQMIGAGGQFSVGGGDYLDEKAAEERKTKYEASD